VEIKQTGGTLELERTFGKTGKRAVAPDVEQERRAVVRSDQRPVQREGPLFALCERETVDDIFVPVSKQQCAPLGTSCANGEIESASKRVRRMVEVKVDIERDVKPGASLVDAEPDQEKRQDHEITRADHEPFELETATAGHEEARTHVEHDERHGSQSRLAPTPSDCCGQQWEDEKEEEGTRRAVRRKDDCGEDRHVDRMHHDRNTSIEPPVAPSRS